MTSTPAWLAKRARKRAVEGDTRVAEGARLGRPGVVSAGRAMLIAGTIHAVGGRRGGMHRPTGVRKAEPGGHAGGLPVGGFRVPSLKRGRVISALLMLRRFLAAMRFALREEDFGRILSTAGLLVIVGTLVYTLGSGWSPVDGFYVAVATLTTSSIADPKLAIVDPWLKVFTALYVLVGIGILVEVARRLGMGFISAREEMREAKRAKRSEGEPSSPTG
jgi:hypothetical protein